MAVDEVVAERRWRNDVGIVPYKAIQGRYSAVGAIRESPAGGRLPPLPSVVKAE